MNCQAINFIMEHYGNASQLLLGVAKVFQKCCKSVSKCVKRVSKVFKCVTKALQERYKSVTKALQKRYKSVTKVFQSVSNALQTCFKVFRGSFKRLWTHLGSQWEPQRVRRRVNLEHFGATRGNVKTMLPSRRNHHFLG